MRNLEIACNKFSAKSRYVGTYTKETPAFDSRKLNNLPKGATKYGEGVGEGKGRQFRRIVGHSKTPFKILTFLAV